MSAIYQRARPATFEQVVGQDHVKDVLLAALERGRESHAYLFSGPRGVGKTTTARLLAMALNCESEGDGPRPCGECDSCRLVRAGNHPDVIELDAASNNSVDDVRELREKTNLASMRGGKRVWILDEAHMLSKAAANALLKTLEEPPPGLVFVLATTEPEKLPPTVLSRCQHFRFRRLSEAEIIGKLERLSSEAGVEAEPEALALVARAADGAMRDAESLLERLLTPGALVTLEQAEDALGLPPVHRMQKLAQALAEEDLETVLGEAESLYRDGFAPRSIADNLGRVLRDTLRREVMAASAEGPAEDDPLTLKLPLDRRALLRLIHALDDEQDRFARRDDLFSLEVALVKGLNAATRNSWNVGGDSERVAPAAGPADTASGAATRTDRASEPAPGGERSGRTRGASSEAVSGTAGATGGGASALPEFNPTGRGEPPEAGVRQQGQRKETERANRATSGSSSPSASPTVAGESGSESARGKPARLDWHAVRSAAGPQLKAFLMPARESVEGDRVVVRYAETHRFHYSELKKREGELARLIEEVAGPGYDLRIEGPGESTAKKP